MVVGQERLPQLGELVVPQLPVHQMAVELLGGQGRDLSLQVPQDLLLGGLAAAGGAVQPQVVDGGLHGDVAGQVPAPAVDVRADEQMAEHAVEHDVQIVPHGAPPLRLVGGEHVVGVVEQVLAVRGQGAGVGGGGELVQRHVQKPQMDQQGVPGQEQDVLGQCLHLMKFFDIVRHMGFTPLLRAAERR